MKTADLYIRVSTDEQADKGYSQRSQADVLTKYCQTNHIQVRKLIYEDHSAKTFMRPEWSKYLELVKRKKGHTNLLLFTKWDRFSRNATDAYQMISFLRKLGIEPVAIEQPLDTTVPENKMILAVYLTAPEIENDRRALNTFFGIRQAKKEGRWMGFAPIGYKNKTNENGRKYIALVEPEATIMKWAFETLGEGIFSAEQTLIKAREKGLVCSKNNFLTAIRNPCYMGKIRLDKYKDEEARLVDGLHEPLISEALFYKVQDVMDGRRREYGLPFILPEKLVLRGFLTCPKCGRVLTGSASKGRNNYFYYYHCSSSCGIRYAAEKVNDAFLDELKKYQPKPGMAELYSEVVMDNYKLITKQSADTRKQTITEITTQHNRVTKARELLLSGDLDADDYKTVKNDCDAKITRLEALLEDLETPASINHLNPIVNRVVSYLSRLDINYLDADISKKRELIGSIFLKKWQFDGEKHRTAQVNEAASHIYLINKNLQGKKNGAKSNFLTLPHEG